MSYYFVWLFFFQLFLSFSHLHAHCTHEKERKRGRESRHAHTSKHLLYTPTPKPSLQTSIFRMQPSLCSDRVRQVSGYKHMRRGYLAQVYKCRRLPCKIILLQRSLESSRFCTLGGASVQFDIFSPFSWFDIITCLAQTLLNGKNQYFSLSWFVTD